MAIELGKELPFVVGGAAIDPVSREAKYADGQERLQPQTLKVFFEMLEINVTAADAYREKNMPNQPVVFDPKKTMWGEIEQAPGV